MKLTQKQLILIVGIVTLIIAGGLVGTTWYYQEYGDNKATLINTQTNENGIALTSTLDISDWKTYENKVWGFSFQYPREWTILQDNLPAYIRRDTPYNLQGEYLLIGTKDINKEIPSEYLQLWISPAGWWPISGGKDHVGIDKSIRVNKADDHFVVTEIKNDGFEVDEESANSYIVSVFDEADAKDRKFVMYYGAIPEKLNNINEIVNTSVPTFNFFEPVKNTNTNISNANTNTSTIDTSDWQTYANEEYGYSLKYPEDYSDQIWSGNVENSAVGLLSEWGMNKGQETIFSISVYLVSNNVQKLYDTDLIYEKYNYKYRVFSSFVNTTDAPEKQKLYQGILASLTFSAPNITNTSDWKSYTNNEVGYSVKYPQDWSVEETNHSSELVNDTTAYFIQITDPNSKYSLHLGVRKEGDSTKDIWYRTGIGAGDMQTGETITISGTNLQLWNLVFEDKPYEVFANDLNTADFPTINGKEFVFTFGCDSQLAYEAYQTCLGKSIVETSEYQTMKAILESLTLS
jgi:hypothetical protein